MLNVGQTYSVTIEDTNIYAKGVCHIDNMVVFVDGAITEEECDVIITKVYPRYAYANCVGILKSSAHRIIPTCKYFGNCGGCAFSHITLDFENLVKYNYVKSAFKKQGIEAKIDEIACPVSRNYRNKVVLFFDGERFGYMAKATNKIVSHNSCELNDEVFDKIADFTAKELKGNSLRALYLRKSSHKEPEIMVCPVFYKSVDMLSYVSKLVNEFPNVKTVLASLYKEKDFALENAKFKVVYGDGYINDVLCGLNFRISPESFYQVNHDCAEILYEKAIELAKLNDSTVCADLFCGTGTIGIISAHKTGATVYGVEIVESAVEDAKYNAKSNGVKNAFFKATDASEFDKQVDVCIVDPPRKGCSTFMIDTLKRLKPRKIVYVSCNTDTLVRDVKALSEFYQIATPVSIFNLFPRTSHVESVVCLCDKSYLHSMKLDQAPFEKIKDGEKTIELRLFDEKRQRLRVGDEIVFLCRNTGEQIIKRIEKLHLFENFEELYKNMPLLKCGYTAENVAKASFSDMEAYYSKEDQKKYGVVGIELS